MHFLRSSLFLILLASCASMKKKPAETKGSAGGNKAPALQSEWQSWPSPWWSAKAKLTLQTEGVSIPLNVSIRAEEGKAIWFSATAFGLLEVARGKMDADSIRILDKMNHRCIRTAVSGFGSLMPLKTDVRQLQHFLMGRVFWDSLETGNSRNRLDTVHLSGVQASVAYRASLLGKYQLLRADAELQSGGAIQLKNSSFQEVSGFPVAFKKELSSKIPAGEKTAEGGLKIEFSRFEFLGNAPDMEFSLPDDCSPMELK